MANNNDQNLFPLKYVEQQTGLSANLIRAWESRYQAVNPVRLKNRRRAYSKDQIERLILLKEITDRGHTISQVACLPDKELRDIYFHITSEVPFALNLEDKFEQIRTQAFDYITDMRPHELDQLLTSAAVEVAPLDMIENVIVPLMHRIGDEWETGDLSISHEHMTSAVIRFFLESMRKAYRIRPNAPKIVIATPSEHYHEIGALIIAAIAASQGWNVIYLGANTPLADIANTALNYQVAAIGISLTYPKDYETNKKIIQDLKLLMPFEMPLFVGGQAVKALEGVFEDRNIYEMVDLSRFKKTLWQMKQTKTTVPTSGAL